MKKSLEMFGLAILICFSFFLTEKTSLLIKDNDSLMETIKEKSNELQTTSIDAQINQDEIIPGLNGKVVDIERSYQVMKKIGMYHSSLLVFKEIEPVISIEKNYDKYIVSGNQNKKMVSLIFKVEQGDKIESVLNILADKQVSVNFFIDGKWLEENISSLKDIVSKNHVIGNLGYLKDYEHQNSYWVLSNIKRNTYQNNYYCYCEEKNEIILKKCASEKQYTILPKLVISNNLLAMIQKNLQSGNIISIDINDNTISQLVNALDFITTKGYKIVHLDTLLEE